MELEQFTNQIKMKILIENSTWTNIGNGFYGFSLYYMVSTLFPEWDVAMMEGPITSILRPGHFAHNAFRLNEWQQADVYIFSGPILGKDFVPVFGPLLKRIVTAGQKYCILSAHADGQELERNLTLLHEFPPIAFSSRDLPTFRLYQNVCEHTLDGVCAAAVVSHTCPVAAIDPAKKFVTVSFYETPEPKLTLMDGSVHVDLPSGRAFERKRLWRILRHFEWLRTSKSAIGSYEIIRPVHDVMYKFPHLNFPVKNRFVSLNPLSYLSLYKHTSLTISNRIHSVIPTLSYGHPVVYFGSAKRNALFERLGIRDFIGRRVELSAQTIENEYVQMQDFMRSIAWE